MHLENKLRLLFTLNRPIFVHHSTIHDKIVIHRQQDVVPELLNGVTSCGKYVPTFRLCVFWRISGWQSKI